VLGIWAEKDGAAAFLQYRELGLNDPRALTTILQRIAKQEPAQAIARLAELDDLQRAQCAPRIVQGWAEKDPAAALAWALEHGISLATRYDSESSIHHDGFQRSHWSGGGSLTDPFGTAISAKPQETLAWIRSLPTGPQRTRLLEMATGRWKSSHEALALFAELPPEAQARTAGHASTWFADDPERGRRWADALPPGPIRERAWAGLGRLPFTFDLPPGADRDAMLAGSLHRDGAVPKPAERLATIRQIGDPVLQRDTLDDLMEYYAAIPSPETEQVSKALDEADFPAEWKRRWQGDFPPVGKR
jgi:hypothetical protein